MPSFRLAFISLLMLTTAVLARGAVGNWDACSGRLERALDTLQRESARRNRLDDEEAGMTYQQELQTAPLEMTVSRIAVKFPRSSRIPGGSWARVERCAYEPVNDSLQTRVIFNDLAVSGMVSLLPRVRRSPIPAESCRMTLRLRRSGVEFFTSPIARGRGQMRIRTESSFLEPRFASIYAYGCRPTRGDKQIKRQDKWPPLRPPKDEMAVSPGSSLTYEAAEPRHLPGISKEVDVPIPNENQRSQQSSQQTAASTTLGIWKKNFWVTKSPLRRRSINGAVHEDTNGTSLISVREEEGHRIQNQDHLSGFDKTEEIREKRLETPKELDEDLFKSSSDGFRVQRSAEVITPQDFVLALVNRNSQNLQKSINRQLIEKNVTIETNETLTTIKYDSFDSVKPEDEDPGDRVKKLNLKRESLLGGDQDGTPRETRELYLDENLDDGFSAYDEGARSWQSKEYVAREMEDVFLRGASQALTRYIERQLHPAIKETLMLSMGYTISYG